MKNIEGLELHEIPIAEYCCSFSGTFAVGDSAIFEQMVTVEFGQISEMVTDY